MAFPLMYVVLVAAVLAGWAAIAYYWRLDACRRASQNAEFEDLTRARADLNAELDRVWAEESERIRRGR